MMFKFIQFSIPSVLVAFGVFQTVSYFLVRRKIKNWDKVEAEILGSRYVDQLGPDGEEILKGIVAYKYSFQGKEYYSEEPAIRAYEFFSNRKYEKCLTEKYKKGAKVVAYVYAREPELAFLEVAPLSLISTIAAFFLPLLGVALAYGLHVGLIQEWLDFIVMKHSIFMHNINTR